VQEPGLDQHRWISRFEAIEQDIRDDPAEYSRSWTSWSELMTAHGIPLAESDGEEIAEPETIRQFEEARRVTRVLDAGDPSDPGDVANAVNAYRSLYVQLRDPDPAGPTD
jgi:hypothetical protein